MKAILACEKNGGIGYQGSMPWPKQSKDLKRFKELTTDTTVLMGRGTWEATGMPKPLPNRKNVVLTTAPPGTIDVSEADADNVIVVNKIADLPEIDWIIGGAGVIGSLWDQIDELHLSHLFAEYECDTSIDLDDLNRDFYCSRSQLNMTHTYEIWKRRTEKQ